MTESCGKSKQTLIHLEVQFHAHRILPLQVLLLFQVVMTRFSCEARAMLLTSVPWTNTELELKANHEAFIGGCSKCAGLQQLSFLRALPEAAQFSTQGYLQLQLKKKSHYIHYPFMPAASGLALPTAQSLLSCALLQHQIGTTRTCVSRSLDWKPKFSKINGS